MVGHTRTMDQDPAIIALAPQPGQRNPSPHPTQSDRGLPYGKLTQSTPSANQEFLRKYPCHRWANAAGWFRRHLYRRIHHAGWVTTAYPERRLNLAELSRPVIAGLRGSKKSNYFWGWHLGIYYALYDATDTVARARLRTTANRKPMNEAGLANFGQCSACHDARLYACHMSGCSAKIRERTISRDYRFCMGRHLRELSCDAKRPVASRVKLRSQSASSRAGGIRLHSVVISRRHPKRTPTNVDISGRGIATISTRLCQRSMMERGVSELKNSA